MSLGAFFRRELATSVRSSRVFVERRAAVILAGLIVLGACLLWDQKGWDRTSILGAHRFGLVVFGLLVCAMVLLALGVVVQQASWAIASERDRKSLDALLASRFSSSEIVLGAVGTALFRYANVVAALVPLVILIVFLGGVSPAWVVLGGAGLASLALLLAGISVASSIGARTANRAVTFATGVFGSWLVLPPIYMMLRPVVWSGAPTWLTSAVVTMLDGSPIGLLMNLARVVPRPGGPAWAVGRMVAWQVAGALGLIAWSIARLRPASRSLYDVEGEQGRIKRLKAALGRPPRRPPCSDDPVLWYEIHASRDGGLGRRVWRRAVHLAVFAGLALGTWWFAEPAFVELNQRGYRSSPEAFAMPEVNPILRLLINKLSGKMTLKVAPGQARLEFNIALRVITSLLMLGFAAVAFSATFEGIKGERRRDTWLALITTPLTGREILRGKARGTLRKRCLIGSLIMLALWTVGLAAGAVHPLGFVAAIGLLATLAAFYPALGLTMALLECNPEKQGQPPFSVVHFPALLVGSVLLTAGPTVLGWSSLLTYEDLAAAIQAGPFPPFGEAYIAEWMAAGSVLVAWVIGTAALALGACWLTRRNERGFDASVGRPVRAVAPEAVAIARVAEAGAASRG